MGTIKNLEVTLNKVRLNKGLKDLIKESKKDNKSLFKVHREVLKLYKTIDFEDDCTTWKQIAIIENDEKFNPFALLFGTLSLDKALKAFKSNDFFSFMELHFKAIRVYIDSNKETQQNILLRGEAINKLSREFKAEKISGLNFAKQLFEFYPSFYESLKSGKIAPNVAKFLFENDNELYTTLSIKNIYDVEHENFRAEMRKNKGAEGLEAFDAEYEAKKANVNIKRTKANASEAIAN